MMRRIMRGNRQYRKHNRGSQGTGPEDRESENHATKDLTGINSENGEWKAAFGHGKFGTARSK